MAIAAVLPQAFAAKKNRPELERLRERLRGGIPQMRIVP
jgi:hypothetical protein